MSSKNILEFQIPISYTHLQLFKNKITIINVINVVPQVSKYIRVSI